ncbi:Adenylate cyclase type 8 [Portunus trituberculatus]|uniref:adenylate cyclase n=1 Tax=Portunus trituberculatus TaxID=210409 RepID=A0A5B7KD03_PORTR|nr:Adenylate cyclase type 8 [Portunus trituberculatus]
MKVKEKGMRGVKTGRERGWELGRVVGLRKDAEDSHAHLCALVDFALEMKARLEDVNKHSFNNFRLRVGM